MRALHGIRVLEIGEMVAAPYAAKLLADLGAAVIKVEPVAGDEARRRGPFPPGADADPEQSGLFLGLNTNKRSVAVDMHSVAGKERIAGLVANADIVIHSLTAGVAADIGLDGIDVLNRHPEAVVCAITPYGHSGPQADWLGEEINVVHGGGWGYLIPGDDPDPAAPPLTLFGHPANCQAGMAGALACLAAYRKAQQTGIGEFIDLAAMSHVAGMLEASFIAWSYMQRVAMRNDGRILTPWHIYPCSDGLIFLVTVEQDQWERLVEMMGDPEWAVLDVFATTEARSANQDLLNIYIEEWTRQHTVEELFHDGQQRRICFAPVFTMADLARQEHLAERGFFHQATHDAVGEMTHMGAPYVMTPNPWQLRSAAPMLNQHRDAAFDERDAGISNSHRVKSEEPHRSQRPLEGVRVIDFSWVWAGPYCTMHLAFLGAEVIKVESSSRPSLGRRLPVHPPEVEASLDTCGYFNQWDQGKKSIELDLTNATDLQTARELIKTADVVVDNYATGVMDRLGLSDEEMRSLNPEVIMASITGFGHTGPLREYMGYGPTTAPLSGLTSMTGHVDGKPEEAGLSFGDPAAGLSAAFAIVASLATRRPGDDGTRIDVSLWEATAANAIEGWMGHALGAPEITPMGSRHPRAAPHGIFRCAGDDAWVSIACMTDEQWNRLADLLDSDLAQDSRFATAADRKTNETALEEIVSAFTSQHQAWDVTEMLQHAGIAAYPSLSCPAVEANEQLVARSFWERFDHPAVGVRTHSGVPWRTVNAANGVTRRAPLLGEHSAEILSNLPQA